ncbi:MAG: pyocin activator PrtN family protein [Fulvimarina manganoxydans]|uniref:pyocin activator PrtN family protein n=1 Tax=Fulvimarina manganoxydans TaxID=937218 RepID=UPI002354C28A|nr:pyocin activator PrtN family protein [Fulvimarina manganoxydans]MCK5932068.1 pyocin activator PrtN family protein [Fulvimarina manganoxydans]
MPRPARPAPPAPEAAPSTTVTALLAQHGAAVVPLEAVRESLFAHLSRDVFKRRLLAGDFPLPVMRADDSQKAALGVHIDDLAAFIDARRAEAQKELAQIMR